MTHNSRRPRALPGVRTHAFLVVFARKGWLRMAEIFDETGWKVLLQRIAEQGVTPFLGAGISPHPKGAEIAQAWAREHRYPEMLDPTDLARVAQYLSIEVDGMWPKHLLVKRFSATQAPDFKDPCEPHSFLAGLPCEVYVTTNYDSFMSDALRFHKRDPTRLTCRWNDSLARGPVPKPPTVANPWVFHLHGADAEPQSMVLTEDDYVDFLVRSQRDPKMLPHQVVRSLSHTSLLFMGYSLTDWTFRVLFRGVVCSLPNSLQQRHVAVQLHRSKSEESYLSKYFADGVAAKLAQNLALVRVETSPGEVAELPGDSIEPVQLQVVCTELWRALPPGATVITAEHASSLGDATAALARYYDSAVRSAARHAKVDPVFVRRWISAALATPAKTRGTAYRGIRLTAGLPNPAVDALENSHVIRAEIRAGARWYELTHDRFLRPIERANGRAMRYSSLRTLITVLSAAALVTVLLVMHPWPNGLDDVLLRTASALIAAGTLEWAVQSAISRRLWYWQPCERQPGRARLAAIGRNLWKLPLTAIPGALLVLAAWISLYDSLFTNACYGSYYDNFNYSPPPAITILIHHAAFDTACLRDASTSVNVGIAVTAVSLAAVVAYAWSWMARGIAVRRWRRMAGQRTGAAKFDGEPGGPSVALARP